MPIKTYLTETLGLRVPLVMGGMQWVGTPALAAAASNAGALGIMTALTQPSPEELKRAIEHARSLIDPEIAKERTKYGAFGVNITLLPAVVPPDYEGYARAALEAGVRIFETAGNNPGPVIKILKDAGAFVIHKCTAIRHGQTALRLGADMLSIDGWECAGHPGEDDIGGLVLLALAADQVKAPFIASGGVANGRGLAATLALGAVGANMGTRFMATKESEIDDKIKQVIVQSGERDTAHILRSLRNTTRVFKNKITKEVLELEARHVEFKEIQPLVSGQRGRTVYTKGDPDAGVWTAGQTLGLIHDIPTCKELVARIEKEAEERIRSTYAYVNGPSARL
ncbi:hypothetical protein GLX27_002969 [Malassezia furfur]|uniref:Nitronate monooxygenase n=1 Tax=Malassezia furfur TaxID=55194 RepID=A0ABY8EUB7_MALFU|nr:hypothetical protein CBS14141_002622 [Malassezia furfur]WFD48300.1 hypothetical protein GLX27_002969 [Malassezia furfur]